MQRFHIWLVSLLVSGLWLALTMDRTSAASDAWEAARQPGAVLIMRHALAPRRRAVVPRGAPPCAGGAALAVSRSGTSQIDCLCAHGIHRGRSWVMRIQWVCPSPVVRPRNTVEYIVGCLNVSLHGCEAHRAAQARNLLGTETRDFPYVAGQAARRANARRTAGRCAA